MTKTKKVTVDFIGIGAEKAGSTWVSDMLRRHPGVFIPKKKEIYFFNESDPHFLKVKNPKYHWGLGWYLNHFKGVEPSIVKGEFSPTYLYSKKTAERIYKHFPDVKILIVLRNPVERAFSQYIQDKRFGLLDGLSFFEALGSSNTYIEKGLYNKYIKMYTKVFPKKNIKTILLDDIKTHPKNILEELFLFLGLEHLSFNSNAHKRKSNVARKALFVRINKFMISQEYSLRNSKYKWMLRYLEGSGIREIAIKIRDINSIAYDKKPKLSQKEKVRCYKFFASDIKNLENLLQRDLSFWISS